MVWGMDYEKIQCIMILYYVPMYFFVTDKIVIYQKLSPLCPLSIKKKKTKKMMLKNVRIIQFYEL